MLRLPTRRELALARGSSMPFAPNIGPADVQPVNNSFASLGSPFDTQEDPFAVETTMSTVSPSEGLEMYGTAQRPYVAPIDWSTFDASSLPDFSNIIGDFKLGDGLTPEVIADVSQRQRTEQIDDIGLSRDFFTDEEFASDTKFFERYTPKLEEFKQGQRDALTDLFATDSAEFSTVYDKLDPNSQLNFLEGQYSAGDLERTDYLNLAATALYAEEKRLYPDREEPLNDYYIKGDKLYEVPNLFSDGRSSAFHSKEVILFDNQKLINNDPRRNQEQLFRDAIGSTNYESADTDSKWVKARDNVIAPLARIGASIATGGMSSAVETAVRGLSGETLHAGDWATLGVAGLEVAGVIKPPVDGASVTGPTGIGPTLPSTGVGLGGLTYNQTTALINGAATGNAETLVVGMLGDKVIDKAFTGIEGTERLAGVFQADDAKKALQTVVSKVASGRDLDKAMLSGLGTYVKEGGGLNLPSVDIDLGMLEDVIKAAVKPIQAVASLAGDLVEDAGQVVGDVGSFIDDELIQPIRPALSAFDDAVVQPVGDVIEDVAQAVGDFGSTFDDEVIQPYIRPALQEFDDVVIQPTAEVIEDVAQATGDVIEDVAQVTGDVVEDLAQAIAELAPDINLPDISLPDVNLPELPELPELPWKDLLKMFAGGMLTGAGTQVAAPSPTRTTDDLFSFETEVGLGNVELAKLQRRYLG